MVIIGVIITGAIITGVGLGVVGDFNSIRRPGSEGRVLCVVEKIVMGRAIEKASFILLREEFHRRSKLALPVVPRHVIVVVEEKRRRRLLL